MIAFKSNVSIEEFVHAHPTLKEIVHYLHAIWPTPYMVITRVRTPMVPGESGVHQTIPARACDIRTNNLRPPEGERLAAALCAAFDYGDSRHEVALQHGDGPNRHLHLQVRAETRRRV